MSDFLEKELNQIWKKAEVANEKNKDEWRIDYDDLGFNASVSSM